jgi:gliding motility-associated lipoprotein GldD
MKSVSWFLVLILVTTACRKNYLPRPLGYNRLDLPRPEYRMSPDSLPYRFAYSTHARLLQDTSRISERYWVEINYPELKATIHITYKDLQAQKKLLREYLQDSYTLTAKHQIKAYAIDESIIHTPSGKAAIVAEIDGEVPSQFQFTLTDSTHNFLRGAVYFYTRVNNDSLAPAIKYVKADALRLINTLQWRAPRGWH